MPYVRAPTIGRVAYGRRLSRGYRSDEFHLSFLRVPSGASTVAWRSISALGRWQLPKRTENSDSPNSERKTTNPKLTPDVIHLMTNDDENYEGYELCTGLGHFREQWKTICDRAPSGTGPLRKCICVKCTRGYVMCNHYDHVATPAKRADSCQLSQFAWLWLTQTMCPQGLLANLCSAK